MLHSEPPVGENSVMLETNKIAEHVICSHPSHTFAQLWAAAQGKCLRASHHKCDKHTLPNISFRDTPYTLFLNSELMLRENSLMLETYKNKHVGHVVVPPHTLLPITWSSRSERSPRCSRINTTLDKLYCHNPHTLFVSFRSLQSEETS